MNSKEWSLNKLILLYNIIQILVKAEMYIFTILMG